MLYWFSGIFTVACIAAELLKPKEERKPLASMEAHEGFTVTRTARGNQEEIWFRGSYDDIMRHLGVIKYDDPAKQRTPCQPRQTRFNVSKRRSGIRISPLGHPH